MEKIYEEILNGGNKMKYCPDCGANIDESDQTEHEYKNGICPECGGGNVKEIDEDQMRYDERVRFLEKG